MASLGVLTLMLLALAGPASAGRLAQGSPAAAPDALSLELDYWGTPMLSWRIGSDGKGEYRAVTRAPSASLQDYDIAVRRFDAGPGGFRQIRAIMDGVARLAPRELPCNEPTTDLPYGQVRWHRGPAMASLAFNFGCREDLAQRVMARLGDATSLASSWASSQPVVEVSHVRGGAQPGPS